MSEFAYAHLLARCSDFSSDLSLYPEVKHQALTTLHRGMPVNFRVYVLAPSFRLELTLDLSQLVFGHVFVLITSGLNEIFVLLCGLPIC